MLFRKRIIPFLLIVFAIVEILQAQPSQFIYTIDENEGFGRLNSAIYEFEDRIYFTDFNILFELSEEGNLLNTFQVLGLDVIGNSIIEVDEDGFLFCGLSKRNSRGIRNLVLMKTDKNLNEIWSEVIQNPSEDTFIAQLTTLVVKIGEKVYLFDGAHLYIFDESIKETISVVEHGYKDIVEVIAHENQIVFTVRFPSENDGKGIISIDSEGKELWTRKISANSVQGLKGKGGDFFVTGLKNLEEGYLLKLNNQGDSIWMQSYPFLSGRELTKTNDGGFLLLGTDRDVGGFTTIKTDSLGNRQWRQFIKGLSYDGIVQLDNDNSLIIGEYDPLFTPREKFLKVINMNSIGQFSNDFEDFKWYRPNKSTININNIQTSFDIDNYQFNNVEDIGIDDLDFFKIPNSKPLGTIAAGGSWIGGLDNTDQLHLAAQGYIFEGFNTEDLLRDYQPGVVKDNSEFYN